MPQASILELLFLSVVIKLPPLDCYTMFNTLSRYFNRVCWKVSSKSSGLCCSDSTYKLPACISFIGTLFGPVQDIEQTARFIQQIWPEWITHTSNKVSLKTINWNQSILSKYKWSEEIESHPNVLSLQAHLRAYKASDHNDGLTYSISQMPQRHSKSNCNAFTYQTHQWS
jgi:hypothetical protein